MNHATLESALDMLDYALLIVDERGRLTYRNRSASMLLRSPTSPFVITGGAVRGRSKIFRGELRSAINQACTQRSVQAVFALHAGLRPLRIVVAPICMDGQVGGAIWIVPRGLPGLPDERTLRTMFGLSPAEARLGLGLLAGSTARECARNAGVGVATIRSQLHSMFAKTGTRRQAELVATLSRIPPLEFTRLSTG
jgi:DNA-binding CsgD family transcriptional regulator